MTNQEISRLFSLYAELLILHNQDERMADWLAGAAYRLRRLDQEAGKLTKQELASHFRPAIVKLIDQLEKKGGIADLDELIQLTPSGLFDMMRIKGLGGKKLSLLWRQAKIDNIEDLLKACKAHRLQGIPGFGAKTEANILAGIESLNSNADHFHYADVADVADGLVTGLQKVFKTAFVSLCGDIRRQTTTVERIEIITVIPATKFKLSAIKKWMTISSSERSITKGHTLDEIPVSIYHTTEDKYVIDLFERTGNEAHINKVKQKFRKLTSSASEEAIYKKAKLPFIPPEMREDVAEWEYSKKPAPLVTGKDIKGVVHNHTTWSDGVDSLESFVMACRRKGYEYTVISDHSRNAHYAGGLKPEKVLRQFEAIDELNDRLSPFRIFKSIECDILVSGELDFDRALLKKFDLVIVSIHQQLKMSEEKATARIIKAIENPYTTILGHMTGRQLLIRPGYPLNFKKVIDACAANGVVIEVNANPYRLDMDWSHIPYALEKGVMISINPDAHSVQEIDNIRWGVSAARKGGLTKEMTWNSMSLEQVLKWLKKRRPAR